jgi:hypothetical protein
VRHLPPFVKAGIALASLASVVGAAQEPAAKPSPQVASALVARLKDKHATAWQPCHEAIHRLLRGGQALGEDAAKDEKVANAARKEIAEAEKAFEKGGCPDIKKGIVAEIRAGGVAEADMNANWKAFATSFDKPAPEPGTGK